MLSEAKQLLFSWACHVIESYAPAQISAPLQGAPILLLVPGVQAANTSRLDPRMQGSAALTPGYDSLHRDCGAVGLPPQQASAGLGS